MVLNILKDRKNNKDLYVFIHIVITFQDFVKVLRKQEVYCGTFPVPLKTNLIGYWFEGITVCACLIRITTIPQLQTIHAERLYSCK